MKIKNLFWGMLAFAGIITMASCQQDDFVGGETAGDYVDATFTVATADGISTRATIGNGTTVNKVACTVYDANGDEMENLYQIVDVKDDKTATYKVRLAKGQAYRAVFFAYNNEGNYYNVEDLKNIEVIGGQDCNVEARDAFTAYYDVTAKATMNTISTEPIELKRPLAQLNLGIDADELKAAADAGIVISESYIKVSNVYNTFDAYESVVVGNSEEVEFAMNEIPTEMLEVELNGTEGIQNDEKFTYLALNYLLVGDLNSEKTLTDVEFIWATADGKTNIPTTSFPNVRTQRNYRTNILGKLITNPAAFNLVIDDRFDGNKQYDVEDGDIEYATVEDNTTLQEAIDAATEGTTIIKFAGDIDGTTRAVAAASITVRQKVGVNLVIDGCGNNFDGTFYLEGGNQGGESPETLTFRNINFVHGEGALDFISADNAKDIGKRYAHNVTVDGCTFTGNSTADVVGMRYRQTYNMTVKNSTFKNMHSAMWATGGTGINFDNVTIEESKNGVSFGTTTGIEIANSNFAVNAYGVRCDGNNNANIAISNTKISAEQPVIVRKMTGKQNVALNNVNFETSKNFHVVFTSGSDDEEYKVPTGTYTITGAEELSVYPEDAVTGTESFNAAIADESKSVIVFADKVENIGEGFEINRDVVLNMEGKELNAGSTANSTWYAIEVFGENTVVINDANFTRAGIWASKGANVVFNSGVINHNPERTSRYIFTSQSGATITINGGTFNNDRAKNSFLWANENSVIYVKGGNFGGVASNSKVVTTGSGQVIISGGTFNFDPTNWLAEGCVVTNNNGTWTVSAE